MTRDEIDARILARMRREVDECIERDENPLLVEVDLFQHEVRARHLWKWVCGLSVSGQAWGLGCVACFLFLRIGLAGPLGMDVVTTEFWIGCTILLGLFACLVGRTGRRG